jgi:hypothetical protein
MVNFYKLQTKTGARKVFRGALNLSVPKPVVEGWRKKKYYVYDKDILIKVSPFKTFYAVIKHLETKYPVRKLVDYGKAFKKIYIIYTKEKQKTKTKNSNNSFKVASVD